MGNDVLHFYVNVSINPCPKSFQFNYFSKFVNDVLRFYVDALNLFWYIYFSKQKTGTAGLNDIAGVPCFNRNVIA